MPMLSEFVIQVGLLLAVSVPLRVLLRHQTKAKLILDAVVFVALSGLFFSRGIEPYRPGAVGGIDAVSVAIAKAAWWISISLLLVTVVRKFLVFNRRPREGRLVRDLLSGVIYIGTALSIVAYVFNVPVGTLIATSGVFAIVLGLALQSTLNDVFSGIALNLNRPYVVGDWIVLDDNLQGRVIETNWRSTHLLNGTNDIVILPNSILAKARLTNYSSPDESHGIVVTVRFHPTERPEVIGETMKTALLGCTNIVDSPPPSVAITALEGDGVTIDLVSRVRDVGKVSDARNEIYDLVYRHARSANLVLSSSTQWTGPLPYWEQASRGQSAVDCLSSIPLFHSLREDERASLGAAMKQVVFPKGAVIARQGTSLTSLLLIQKGVVIVEIEESGRHTELTRLSPGDFFGERGVLMGAIEAAEIRSLTPVTAYEIKKDTLAPFLGQRPEIAEELGFVLAHRLEKEKHLLDQPGMENSTSITLSGKIRSLFGL
ncbi:mechanosensitive ion channel (plasmid) [Agrobacterium sp. 33MFTa1.1]|uniref:mechanosensitive ion channel family protein n=1 Tax=Agrobacterium sp. 33MFTa1.1 TaxID=1279031 RepID=UPI000551E384|nr:mechanosensitive ion channel family protein [Agrobacterium sp. 33MFTa1.1]QBJ16789.1 mechanosensitive ion channel [Agrobacterium sp. 33MFTa1.1]